MKKNLFKTGLIFLTFITIQSTEAQNVWTQETNFPGAARYYDAGFSIGHYGFIGNGHNLTLSAYYNDFYKWDKNTNTWSAIASYPGAGQASGIACSVNGKGYVGLGLGNGGEQTDMWSYDTTTNTWTQLASLPSSGRYDVSFFVIGNNIYLVGGSTGGPPYLSDVWCYNTVNNKWTQKNNSPAPNTDVMVAFAIGNHGYIGGGFDYPTSEKAFWEYDTTNDTWTSIAPWPVSSGVGGDPRAFVIGSTAYVCTGTYGSDYSSPFTLPEGYAYDTVTKTWSAFTNMFSQGIARAFAAAFTIGNYGYIGTGIDSNGNYLNSFWQYEPQPIPPVQCNTWTQETNFPGAARYYDAGFSIGQCGFIGNGHNLTLSAYYNDFYKWDKNTNTWSAIASYPGAGQASGIACSVNGKGYVGLGLGNGGEQTDMWSYDTTTNTWTQLASLPSSGRYDVSFFVIGNNIYLVGGSTGGPPYLSDVWCYNTVNNKWTQKNNSPAPNTDVMVAFAIGNHGYIGGGFDYPTSKQAFWEYDTTNDTWTSIAPWPVSSGVGGDPRAFVIGSTAYVCTGTYGSDYSSPFTLPEGYAYDTVTKTWSAFTNMFSQGIARAFGAAFMIDNYGYIGTGIDSNGNYLNSFWQYYPCSDTLLNNVNDISTAEMQINLYPNPSNGNLTISYQGLSNEKRDFKITDVTGRTIRLVELNGDEGKLTLDESNLENGIYFYQVTNNSGNLIGSGKFIIVK